MVLNHRGVVAGYRLHTISAHLKEIIATLLSHYRDLNNTLHQTT